MVDEEIQDPDSRGGLTKRAVGTEGCPHALWRHEDFSGNEEAVGRPHRRSLPRFGLEGSWKDVGNPSLGDGESILSQYPVARLRLLFDGLFLLFSCVPKFSLWRNLVCRVSLVAGRHSVPGGLLCDVTISRGGLTGNFSKNTAEVAQILEAHIKVHVGYRALLITQ